ncbi:hypothetical protein ABZ714_08025 [Streptomyces sp. NPDC006798]|uniref:hypothetical protein n=1 Tax=Streptomyces sp. NPDC006798 TaxID=3155462 RepID=UPI0033F6E6A1
MEAVHMVDLDCPAVLAVARMHDEGVPLGVAAAAHAARHLPEWGTDGLVATAAPEEYGSPGVPVLDPNR